MQVNHLQEKYQTPYSVRTAALQQQEHSPCLLSQECFLAPSSHKTNSHFSLRCELWRNLIHGSLLLFLSPQADLPPGWSYRATEGPGFMTLVTVTFAYIRLLLIVTFYTGTWASSKQEVLSRITLFPVAVVVASICCVFKLIQANWTFPVLRRLR